MTRAPWLFSRELDLAVFGGSAALALGLLAVGHLCGFLHGDAPEWVWLLCVLGVDVAHVWSSTLRIYLDPVERRRRPVLYALAPILGLAVAIALHTWSAAAFWRALAYLAAFHFVRQQVGWVALYRARAGDRSTLGRVIDEGATYAATLWPLLHWHAHLPRRMAWFVQGDFASTSALRTVELAARPVAAAFAIAYVLRAAVLWRRGAGNPGKDLVVATTAACWIAGIVVVPSDFAFTVTNVLIHGIPYLALVWTTGRRAPLAGPARGLFAGGPAVFVGLLVAVAFVEELGWDRAVWHDRAWLFGGGAVVAPGVLTVLVPLLAVPQITHYVLDGFIWRRGTSADRARLG